MDNLYNSVTLSLLTDTELWEVFDRCSSEYGRFDEKTQSVASELEKRDWDPYPVTSEDYAEWRKTLA